LNSEVVIEPDFIALAAATIPPPENAKLAQMLKVPLSKDKFFLEAHMKLRPVEFSTEGIFLCGLAHSPKFFEECIAQANAAVSRACTILSLDNIESEGLTSRVDPKICSGCKTCIVVCPQGAISINSDGCAEVFEVLCKGCGICAASCPEKAISIVQFTDEQLLAQVEAAISEPFGINREYKESQLVQNQKNQDMQEIYELQGIQEPKKLKGLQELQELPEAQEVGK
jgi:heterodisulfide reductase subunit A